LRAEELGFIANHRIEYLLGRDTEDEKE